MEPGEYTTRQVGKVEPAGFPEAADPDTIRRCRREVWGPRMRRWIAAVITFALLAAACGSGDDDSTDATTTTAATTTRATTTTRPTTTTTEPLALVTTNISGDGENAQDRAVADVYVAALNPGQETAFDLPAGLLEQYADREPQLGPATVTGTIATATVMDTPVAVFSNDDGDVVLMIEAGPSQWSVVGAKLTSLGEPAWYGHGPRFLLVIGSDARPGQRVNGFRADSVHIISLVPGDGSGAIVGIPRDSWVETSYGGTAKLTNTMASRGPQVVQETVTLFTGIEFEGYVITGFAGFANLVDEFGGFSVDVPYGMSDSKSGAFFSSGEQHFDGTDALAFARNRTDTPGGDFGRQLNHGRLMLAALTATQDRGIADLPMLLSILTSIAETTLSPADLLTFAAAAYELDPELTTNIVASGRVGTAGAASVVRLTDEAFVLFDDVGEDGTVDGEY